MLSTIEKSAALLILKAMNNGSTTINLDNYTCDSGVIDALEKGNYITAITIGVLSNGFHDEPHEFKVRLKLRGKVATLCNSFKKVPEWSNAFPDIQSIPLMDSCINDKWYGASTWLDYSYSNDVSPHFISFDLIDGKAVKIWSDDVHVDGEEYECDTQYSVHLYDVDGEDAGDFIKELLATNDRNEVFGLIIELEQREQLARRIKSDKKSHVLTATQSPPAPILDFHFENDNHVASFMYYLIAENLQYHFDDKPLEITWTSRNMTVSDKAHMDSNNTRLWAYCNPWGWFDENEELWALWTGNS